MVTSSTITETVTPAAVAALSILASVATVAANQAFTVSGVATDASTPTPLPVAGATVTLNDITSGTPVVLQTTTSGSDGSYTFQVTYSTPGTYLLDTSA